MSPVGTKLAFEVLRFTAAPASGEVAVLALEGRFRAPTRRRLGAPRLLAEDQDERLEVSAADGGDATADPDGVRWRASFAVPLRMLGNGGFALAVGREMLVDLPSPDRDEESDGAADLHVRLAREANALRALADEARAAATAALGRADDERSERERLAAELRGARHAREEMATRLGQFESELAARDEALERLRREHRAELTRRDEAARQEGDERVAAVEAEAAELRRALKSARADVELVRRERDRAVAGRAAVARAGPVTTRLPAPATSHPEQEASQPALPLPEGEAVGPVRAAADDPTASNGDGPGDVDIRGLARDDHDDEPPTSLIEDPERRAPDEADEPEAAWGGDESEGVRVLGRRPRRARSGDEPPVEPLPGTAEIGARHIVPGDISRAGLAVWIARGAAILALAFVVAAVLLVVWGLR
ncbi:MAG: hypothetical protein QOC64_2405 [Solirubrobacteraceae bacterium]|nr:hypothetical protein [Solirubrobacteraceae bacterium]